MLTKAHEEIARKVRLKAELAGEPKLNLKKKPGRKPKKRSTRKKKPVKQRKVSKTTSTVQLPPPKPTIKQKNALLMELGLLNKPVKTASKPKSKGNKKGGTRAKDAAFSDNFNAEKSEPQDIFLDKLLQDHMKSKNLDSDEDMFSDVDLDGISTLSDLRDLYKTMGGKAKLQKLMQKDANFAMILKELLKAELDIMKVKARNMGKDLGGIKEKYVFVVLKGLETDPVVDNTENGDIDLAQIRAAFDPGTERTEQEKEEQGLNAPPEMLFGAGGQNG